MVISDNRKSYTLNESIVINYIKAMPEMKFQTFILTGFDTIKLITLLVFAEFLSTWLENINDLRYISVTFKSYNFNACSLVLLSWQVSTYRIWQLMILQPNASLTPVFIII